MTSSGEMTSSNVSIDDEPLDLPSSRKFSSSKCRANSDETIKLRRKSHREVERRRRETINDGINELASMVPNCEKNNKVRM